MRLILVILSLCVVPARGANLPAGTTQTSVTEQDFYDAERQRVEAKEIQERYRLRVPITRVARAPAPPEPGPEGALNLPGEEPSGPKYLWVAALLTLVGYVALRRLSFDPAKPLREWLDSRGLLPASKARQPFSSDWYITVKSKPSALPRALPVCSPAQAVSAPTPERQSQPTEARVIQPTLILTPERLLAMRTLIQEMAEPSGGVRQKPLLELCRKVHGLNESALQGFMPAWRLASILEQLLSQLEAQPSKAAPSVLRTISGAVDVLGTLCRPGVGPDFWKDLPPRLLAVDDNPLCRHALDFGLKKAFPRADLAPSGESALSLAAEHRYDAIFLDVLMPGMDGLEVCSKIRQTPLNRDTPVVFVTADQEFNAGKKAINCGGADCLAKPFLTFELALKASALVLGNRLEAGKVQAPRLVTAK